MADRSAAGRNHRNHSLRRNRVKGSPALWGWFLFFIAVLFLLFRSDPVLFLQPRTDRIRVDSHLEPTGGLDAVALYASSQDERPWVLSDLGNGSYEVWRGSINHRLAFEDGEGGAPLVLARSPSHMIVAHHGGGQVAILEEMSDGFLQVDVMGVPAGVVTGVFSSSDGLYVLSSTRQDPEAFHAVLPDVTEGLGPTMPPRTVVEDQLYHWQNRRLSPVARFSNAIVLGHAEVTMPGRVPGRDAFLLGPLPDLHPAEGIGPLEMVFLEQGRIQDRWTLGDEDALPWPVTPEVPVWMYHESWIWSSERIDVLLWSANEATGWSGRGESLKWRHFFDEPIIQALLTDDGALLLVDHTLWRIDDAGRVFELMKFDEPVLDVHPLPGVHRHLLIIKAQGIGIYTTEGQVLWETVTERPLRDWVLVPVESDAESKEYYLHVLMAHGVERHRIEMIP